MTDIEKLKDGIEAVARFDERKFGRHSPFHLTACGGCGCPAFQQPCALCGYYPMGSDKGHYSPKEATREMFCSMVERSGPGGRDGTIATWHAVHRKKRYETKEDVAEAAAAIDVPAAAEYWDAVVVQDIRLHRERPDSFAWRAWTAVGDIGQLAMGEFSGTQPSRRSSEIFAAIDGWVDALHSEDRDAILESLVKLTDVAGNMRHEYPRNGNLLSAIGHLSEAIELMNAQPAHAAGA
jgi:hypothetical protein